jgi:hypothetical protein
MARYFNKADVDNAVRERDFTYLCDLVRDMHLEAGSREYLAKAILNLLMGKAKRPRHRPRKDSTRQNKFQIAMRVLKLRREGWEKVSAAVKQAAEEFGCGERKVYDSLKQFHRYVAEEEFDDDRLVRHELHGVFTDEEWREVEDRAQDWIAEHRDDPEPTEDEIEAAGEAHMDYLARLARGR